MQSSYTFDSINDFEQSNRVNTMKKTKQHISKSSISPYSSALDKQRETKPAAKKDLITVAEEG